MPKYLYLYTPFCRFPYLRSYRGQYIIQSIQDQYAFTIHLVDFGGATAFTQSWDHHPPVAWEHAYCNVLGSLEYCYLKRICVVTTGMFECL